MGKKKDKKVKKTVVFDESDRVEFITGFKKRKDERRAKAKAQKEKLIKDAIKEAKQRKRDEMKKLLINYQMDNPELNDLIKPVNFDLPEHVVTITEMDLNGMAGLTNSGLGTNSVEQMNQVQQSSTSSSPSIKIKKIKKIKKRKDRKRH